ncbi:MAG: hypothetical protein FWH53_02560 [Leptospirales bacterium]|nr:hypothetical protein [Leptospirales bacterium]
MSEDKNFLQSIKLELSRNFKLEPYERIAFHKILAHVKSNAGKEILIQEVDRGGDIRISALNALSEFNDSSLVPLFVSILAKEPLNEELFIILDFLYNNGTVEEVRPLIELIERQANRVKGEEDEDEARSLNELMERKEDDKKSVFIIRRAFNVLKKIGENDLNFHQYITDIFNNPNSDVVVLEGAINAASILKNTNIFEELLKRNDDNISYHVFLSIYNLNLTLFTGRDEEDFESYNLIINDEKDMSADENLLLNIKVLLGKITSKYDGFSNKTKNAYLNAMLSCNHRESLIYLMKALESKDDELIRKTFFSLYCNITRLRFPEKILRNLLTMSVEKNEYNKSIVNIFVRFFSERNSSRSDILFRDKLFGNITSTLDSFFETYRREFMIPDIDENSLPENFKKMRALILRNLNPEQKRRLIQDILSDENRPPKKILTNLSEYIPYVDENSQEALSLFIDLIIDEDKIARESTASKIDSVNFEKRYLQAKIIRLCGIINSLNISDAAQPMVYIYNYLKKFPDKEIFDAAIYSLCRINYSYMLSEVEIMLTAGSPEEQLRAVSLLPLFTEKRLMNILVEFLKNNSALDNEVVKGIISILVDQDIKSNISAIEVFKLVIDNNPNTEIRTLAIRGVGNCCITEDIVYLNDLFYRVKENSLKVAAVKGIYSIIAHKSDFDKKQLLLYVQEYMKEPDIKVRIFSCMIFIRLGNKDAFRSIKEMLIIKNKLIQREILSILRDIRKLDFYFFLVSLLKEEFGISEDIIHLLRKLPSEELQEIDSFIINLFRKLELPAVNPGASPKDINKLGNIAKKRFAVLYLTIENFDSLVSDMNFYELTEFYFKIDSIILKPVIENKGRVSDKDNDRLTAWFESPENSIVAATIISKRLKALNNSLIYEKNINARIVIITDSFNVVEDEIFNYALEKLNRYNNLPLFNSIVVDEETAKNVSESFYSIPITEILYSGELSDRLHFELMGRINFAAKAFAILREKEAEILKAKEAQEQIEAQLKNLRTENRSLTSIAIAGELENIGIKLRDEFDEIEKYVYKRSADKELHKNIRVMLNSIYNIYRVEISKLTIK